MRNIITLTKRECLAYFYTPLAYVIMTGFFFFMGLVFYNTLSETPNSEAMREILGGVSFITLIIMPMVTMRLLSEEIRTGTFEILMTAPITETEIVISKFLGGLIFYLFLIVPTIVYLILLILWGNPDLGSLLAWYLGIILMAGAFVAIGLFVSALTANQIVSAIITFVILIIGWWIIPWAANTVSNGVISFLNIIAGWLVGKMDYLVTPLTDLIKFFGFVEHLLTFYKGVIDTRDVVFFVSVMVLFLFLTVRMVESKRWK